MTRFDAATPSDRRSLVADAIAAHRERGSQFCTVEAAAPPPAAGASSPQTASSSADAGGGGEDAGDGREEADDLAEGGDEPTPAWVQYSDPAGQLNLDCTDEEYDRIATVLSDFPAFTVAEQAAPEDAEGRNLRIEAYADADRIAAFVDRLFLEGFGYEEDVRLWATEI